MDIDKEPLALITAFAKKLVKQHGFNTQIESTTNRREALEGADYVIVTIRLENRKRRLIEILRGSTELKTSLILWARWNLLWVTPDTGYIRHLP